MKDMEKAKRKYIKAIKRKITAPAARKKEYLKLLGNQIDDFIEGNNPTDFETVSEHFGTPAEIAETFMSQFSAEEIKKSIRYRRWRAILLIVLALIIYYMVALFVSWLKYDRYPSYYVETIEEGEEIILEE